MGGGEVKGAVRGSQLGSDLPHYTDSVRHSRRSTPDVSRPAQQYRDVVAETPHGFVRTGSFRRAEGIEKRVHYPALVIRSEDSDLAQRDSSPKPNIPVLLSGSIVPEPANLFRIQPLIASPGEQDLHFDLDP